MTKFLSFTIIVLVLGFFAPRVLISDNMDRFEGEKKLFASYALYSAQSLLGGSLEPLIITKFKIEEITQIPNEQCDYGSDNIYAIIQGKYTAVVKGYTVFGLPYTQIYVYCTGAAKIEF